MNSVGDVAIAPETDFGILNVDLGLPSPGLAAGDKTLFDDSRTADADLIDIFTGQPFESATILDGNFYNNLQLNDANPLESQQGKEDAGCANLVSYQTFVYLIIYRHPFRLQPISSETFSWKIEK